MITPDKFYKVFDIIFKAKSTYLDFAHFKFDGMNEDYAYFSITTSKMKNIPYLKEIILRLHLKQVAEYSDSNTYKAEFRLEL